MTKRPWLSNEGRMRSWPGAPYPQPTMVPIGGLRDQSTRITYLPWADVQLEVMGYQVIPDAGHPVLVYFKPTLDAGKVEIRCHATTEMPDPENDRLLASLDITDLLYSDPE